MLELTIIIVYFAITIFIGLISRKKIKGADDFFVAGRKGSTPFITGSLIATIVGGSATVGMAGMAFNQGLTGGWWLLAGSVGLIVLGVFFAKKVRKFAVYTLPGLMEKQYDRRVAVAASILIIIAWVGIVAGQTVAAGKIMGILGIGSPVIWMVLFAAVFIIYTLLGGQQAIIRTDTLQSFIIFAGIFGGLGLLLSKLGGLSGLTENLPSTQFSFPLSQGFGIYEFFSLLLLVGLTYVVGPDMYSRLLCAKDEKTARSSTFWTALLIIPIAFAIVFIGMGASVLFPEISAEQALPTVIKEVLPPFVGGVVLAALLCAMMSSADTCLLSASTILSVDVIKPLKPSLTQEKLLTISRWAIVILGLGSLGVALALKGVISALLFAYTVYTGGIILPVIAGFYRDKLKVTPLAALVAIIGGGSAALISKIPAIIDRVPELKHLSLGSLLISICLLFIVSFIHNIINARKSQAA